MKKLLVILLGLTFVFQATVTSVVFINWKINRKRITELYCINKDNPMMRCEGKCYLSQQLKKIEQDYRQSRLPFQPKGVKQVQLLLFVEDIALAVLSDGSPVSEHQQISCPYIDHYSFDFLTVLRRPPGVLTVIA